MLHFRRRLSSLATSHLDVATTSGIEDKSRYQPVIGLEVHVQLNTKTKLFSRSPNSEGPPNRLVSPFDMATPGVLPVLNKQCVMNALKMGILMNCEIPKRSRFDRKHYFYADMPAGYQITQNEMPIAKNGEFGYYVFSDEANKKPYWKNVNIIQLQLEQDSGKTIHVEKKSLVDYNRAGCALVEVVTSPCFSTALEAICFVQHLRLILMHYGLCGGELHKGQIRVDANVSLSFDNVFGTRTEIKNMNSIRSIHTAINYEIARQFEILSTGGEVVNETRGVDSDGRTVSMRDKEVETDYRFMVEPNIPMLKINPEWLETCKSEIKSTDKPKFEWLRDDVGFDPRTSIHISEDIFLLNFVEKCLEKREVLQKNRELVSSEKILYWMKELKTIMQRSKANYPPQSAFFALQFVKLVGMFENGKLTRLRMLDLLRNYAMSEEDRVDVEELIEEYGLQRITDLKEIELVVRSLMDENKKVAEKCKSGHTKSFNKMRNIIVDKTDKRIEISDIEHALRRICDE